MILDIKYLHRYTSFLHQQFRSLLPVLSVIRRSLPQFPHLGQGYLLLLCALDPVALDLADLRHRHDKPKQEQLHSDSVTSAEKRQAQRVPSLSGTSNSK